MAVHMAVVKTSEGDFGARMRHAREQRGVSLRQIAEATKVPKDYLSKILQGLAKKGIVQTQRGVGGGVSLAKTPEELTILDVVNAVAPLERIRRCPLGLTSHTRLCPLHSELDRVYAATQAALARVVNDTQGQSVALRFELVMHGMEIANGYDELCDAAEQARRFEADRESRRQQQLPDIAADQRLLAAMQHGLPACAGVALGVDRLLMLKLGTRTIDDVLTFPLERA